MLSVATVGKLCLETDSCSGCKLYGKEPVPFASYTALSDTQLAKILHMLGSVARENLLQPMTPTYDRSLL